MLQRTISDFFRKEIHPVEATARQQSATAIAPEDIARLQPKARALGLWCFDTPIEYGGAGLSPFPYVVAYEEASKHTYSLPETGGGVFGYDPPNILQHGSQAHRDKYIRESVDHACFWFVGLTEPSGGSDPARSIQTRARRDGNHWILNGRKMFASRADVAKHGIVFVRTGEGRGGISAIIVDMPPEGLPARKVDTIRDVHSTELTLEDVAVPLDNIIGDQGQGFVLAQKFLVRARLKIAAQAIGIGQASIDIACDYAKERQTFGKPLAARQSVQNMLVDSYVELRAARLLLWEAAWRAENGEDARHAASIAKLFATEKAFEAVDRSIQVLGGLGVCRELPLEHWFRNLRVLRIVEGASEVHRMVLARDLLGEPALDRPLASA